MPKLIAGIGVPGLVALGVVLAVLYFVPTAMAVMRRNTKAHRIILLNVFLGWTVVGWIAALVWSIKGARPADRSRVMMICANCARPNPSTFARCDYCLAPLSANRDAHSPVGR